ncbi:MAG: molybdopterin-dependent oxidoreductase, partial [Eggerthellaceae bacterium]|nr:molybdopterin-dependent oxidoreductase [Eggerthellaceae bacterium]
MSERNSLFHFRIENALWRGIGTRASYYGGEGVGGDLLNEPQRGSGISPNAIPHSIQEQARYTRGDFAKGERHGRSGSHPGIQEGAASPAQSAGAQVDGHGGPTGTRAAEECAGLRRSHRQFRHWRLLHQQRLLGSGFLQADEPPREERALNTKGKTVKKGIGFCATGLVSNICDIDVPEDKSKVTRIRPYHFDETGDMERLNPWKIEIDGKVLDPGTTTTLTPIQLAYKKRVYSKNRILYPMKRVDWDPNGERHPETRGISGYERISWDEALDIITSEMHRIVTEYGVESIYAQADGHGEAKIVHGTHGCQTRLLSRIGTGNYAFQCRQADSWEGWYWGAKHIWGMDPFGNTTKNTNLAKDVAENSDALLMWGGDPETPPNGWGSQMPVRSPYFLPELGVKHSHIAPDGHSSNAAHADKWIPVLPNTDAAMQLAIAYVWLTEGTYDEEYLKTHSVGFENWAYYVMGGEDGIPKTPKWAESRCGVPSYTIKALAR